MTHRFYCTQPDQRGEHDEYFVDDTGAYVMRERVRDVGRVLSSALPSARCGVSRTCT